MPYRQEQYRSQSRQYTVTRGRAPGANGARPQMPPHAGVRPPPPYQGRGQQAQNRAGQQRMQAAAGYSGGQAPAGNGQRRQAPPSRVGYGRPAPRKRRRHPFRALLLLLTLALLGTGCVMFYNVNETIGDAERKETFYKGVYVNDIELYGHTKAEVYNYFITQARQNLSGWSIELRFGDSRWFITADTLGITGSLETVVRAAVDEAYAVGRRGGMIERYQTIAQLKTEPYRAYTSDIEKNTSQIEGILAEIQASVYIQPKNATSIFDFNLANPVQIAQEVNGRELDLDALKAQITQMVSNMQAGVLEIPTKVIVPPVTAASLENQIVRLGNFSSAIAKFSTNERNLNIMRGVERFHGKVIKPGEKVSFNEIVGKRTEKNGFYPALEIVSGEYEMGVGGGICQVSSTLYNAVIQAGLEIISRSNHGLPVSYVEMGADATVSDRGIDFVFRNNTDANLYIVARFEDGKEKKCVFQIYGRPDPNGYTYSLRHEIVEEIPIPEPTMIPDRNAEHVVYTDQTYQASKGDVGYKVRTFLVTKDLKGNEIDSRPIYVDRYSPQAPRVYVGITKRET